MYAISFSIAIAKTYLSLLLTYLVSVLFNSHYITEADDLPDLLLRLEPSEIVATRFNDVSSIHITNLVVAIANMEY